MRYRDAEAYARREGSEVAACGRGGRRDGCWRISAGYGTRYQKSADVLSAHCQYARRRLAARFALRCAGFTPQGGWRRYGAAARRLRA